MLIARRSLIAYPDRTDPCSPIRIPPLITPRADAKHGYAYGPKYVDTWAPWLLTVGGAFAATGMAASSIVDWRHGASRWLVAGEMLLGVIGVAAVVAGIARLM